MTRSQPRVLFFRLVKGIRSWCPLKQVVVALLLLWAEVQCVYLGKRYRTKVEWHPNFWGRVDHLHLRHTRKNTWGDYVKNDNESRNVYLHSKMYNRLCSSYTIITWDVIFFFVHFFNLIKEKHHDHHTELPLCSRMRIRVRFYAENDGRN